MLNKRRGFKTPIAVQAAQAQERAARFEKRATSYLIAMDTDFGLIGSKRFRSSPTPSVDEAKAFLEELWPKTNIYGPLERVPFEKGPGHTDINRIAPTWVKPRIVTVYLSPNKDGIGRSMRNWIPLAVTNVSLEVLRLLAIKNVTPWDEYLPKDGVTRA